MTIIDERIGVSKEGSCVAAALAVTSLYLDRVDSVKSKSARFSVETRCIDKHFQSGWVVFENIEQVGSRLTDWYFWKGPSTRTDILEDELCSIEICQRHLVGVERTVRRLLVTPRRPLHIKIRWNREFVLWWVLNKCWHYQVTNPYIEIKLNLVCSSCSKWKLEINCDCKICWSIQINVLKRVS